MLSHFCIFSLLKIRNSWSFQYSSAKFLSHITAWIPFKNVLLYLYPTLCFAPKFLSFFVAIINFLCVYNTEAVFLNINYDAISYLSEYTPCVHYKEKHFIDVYLRITQDRIC